ncbi:MAG: RNA methyltransferase [Muribaculum sp.]|nr:RNA methyltransferase [Muribaculum sp.]
MTNRLRKMVASLDGAKERRESGLFVVEGTKCVLDTLKYFQSRYIFATKAWQLRYRNEITEFGDAITNAARADLERMSHLSTPPQVLAVYEMPKYELSEAEFKSNLTLVLDRIQDPGNLGTIIRVADWFGIRQIICSEDTVDVFSPKVVQATMGAISRVRVLYIDLVEFLKKYGDDTPCYGTFLYGQDIYNAKLADSGFIVMGNEGQGISDSVAACVGSRLWIPSYPKNAVTSESLNVGTATAITLSEFRRRSIVNSPS